MLKQALVIVSFTLMASAQVNAAPAKKPVVGTIVDVVGGEISAGLGDACIFQIKTDDKKLVALITDYDQCAEAGFESDDVVGKRIHVPAAGMNLIDDAVTVRMYKELDSSYFYMFADFDSVYGGISVGN